MFVYKGQGIRCQATLKTAPTRQGGLYAAVFRLTFYKISAYIFRFSKTYKQKSYNIFSYLPDNFFEK